MLLRSYMTSKIAKRKKIVKTAILSEKTLKNYEIGQNSKGC